MSDPSTSKVTDTHTDQSHEVTALKTMVLNNLKISSPIIVARLTYTASNFVNMSIISRIDESFLASSPLTLTGWRILFALNTSLLTPVSIETSRAYGEVTNGSHDAAIYIGKVTTAGILIGTTLALPTGVIMYYSYSLLKSVGVPPEAAIITGNFFQSLMLGMIPTGVFTSFYMMMIGVSKPGVFASIISASSIASVPMTYFLAHGSFGLTSYGVKGYAYAANITNIAAFSIALSYVFLNKRLKKEYYLFQKISAKELIQLTFALSRSGFYIFVQQSSEIFTFFSIAVLASYLGRISSLEMSIVQQVTLAFPFILTTSVRQGTLKVVAQSLGIDHVYNAANINRGLLSGIMLNLSFTLINYLVYLVLSKQIISVFLDINDPNNKSIVSTTKNLLMIEGLNQCIDSLRNAYVGALNGIGETRNTMFLSSGSIFIVGSVLAYCLSKQEELGVYGLQIGLTAAYTLGTAVLALLWLKETRLKPLDTKKIQDLGGHRNSFFTRQTEVVSLNPASSRSYETIHP